MSRTLLPLAASFLLLSACTARVDSPSPPPAVSQGKSSAAASEAEVALGESQGDPVPGPFGDLESLAFDRDGVLWIGSRYSGIFAFRDGRFYLYDVFNTPIPDRGITAVYVDGNDTKWFGSGRGYIYSFDNTHWKVYPTSTDASHYPITLVRPDGKGGIWFREGGLMRFVDGRIEKIELPQRPNAPKPTPGIPFDLNHEGLGGVQAMDIDREGRLWVAGTDAVVRYDGKDWTWLTEAKQPPVTISSLWRNPKTDEVFLATSDGLSRFRDGKCEKVEETNLSGPVRAVRGNFEGQVAAVCFDPVSAAVGDGLHFRRYAPRTPMANNSVQDAAVDHQGRIWFVGRSIGLRCLDGEKWETPAPPGPYTIHRAGDPSILFHESYPQDVIREEAVDADIHEVLKDPRKYSGKKVRIVGTIGSSFEYAEMIGSNGEKLRMWPNAIYGWGELDESEYSKKAPDGTPLKLEYVGYLDWGGYFGHMGAWSMEFCVIEVYPADADKAQKAEIKRRYLKKFEESANDQFIPEIVETPEVRRAREALQGSWTVIDVENPYSVLGGGVGSRWSITGGAFKAGSPGEWSLGTFKVDPRRPTAIDLKVGDSSFNRRTLRGIYALDGDTLKLCFADKSGRPREFATDRNSRASLLTLKRDPAGTAALLAATNEPAEPDDPDAILALEKSLTGLQRDEHGNVVVALFGFNQTEGVRLTTDADFEPLKKLHYLERIEGQLTDAGLECFADCRRLVRLSVWGKGITDAGLQHLRGLNRLEDLALYDTSITDAGLEKLADLKALKYLNIGKSAVKGPGLAFLDRLATLNRLYLQEAPLNNDFFTYAARVPALEAITINLVNLGDSQADGLGSCAALERLDLAGTKFGDAGMVQMKQLRKLKYLNLGDAQVTNVGMSSLKELYALEEIYLDGTQVGDTGVAELKGLKNLKTLSLCKTQVTDAGLMSLAELPNLKNLRLNDVAVTNAGLKALLKFPSLEELWLERTRVDNDGLEFLKSFPKLQTVTLSRPRITQEAAETLGKELPKVRVSYANQGFLVPDN